MLDGGAEDDDEEEDGEHDRHGEGGDELVRLIRGDLLRVWGGTRGFGKGEVSASERREAASGKINPSAERRACDRRRRRWAGRGILTLMILSWKASSLT